MPSWRRRAPPASLDGITSVCSAHPLVIEAALVQAQAAGGPALIEATCNQVNQEGGYTGMTPADFRDYVFGIAERVGFAREQIILGGDHLGPNPWKDLDAEEALRRAEAMVAAFVEAGYVKIHLDASMGCKGEPAGLSDEVTAGRAARLARAAEDAAARAGTERPFYIIGTEVPIPGGALEVIEHLEVTAPEAAAKTRSVHRHAFAEAGVEDAFARVIGLVVQPGVEFGHENVVVYDPAPARALSASLERLPGLVFEAHSTDYQPADSLRALVRDGFAILKVGPGLTFALREALYALDQIAMALDPSWREQSLVAAMERRHACRPQILALVLSGSTGAAACASPLQLQRSHPLLLAGPHGGGGCGPAPGPSGGCDHPAAADQSIPALYSTRAWSAER